MKKVAVFDIDGTIFRSSLLIELVETLIVEGVLPDKVKDSYQKQLNAWLDRRGSYEAYINAIVDAWYGGIAGVPLSTIEEIAAKVIDIHRDRVYRYTRDLVGELKKEGYYLLAISRSPKTIGDRFAANLGFDKVYGDLLEIDNHGCLTGRVIGDEIADKAKILKRAVEKGGLTLDDSVGVGDTEGDVPMLELVSRPICFNPNSQLYDHAKKSGWEVIVERKDVIYKL